MKKLILLLVLAVSVFASCTNDGTDEDNALNLTQLDETQATGKDCGSSPGDKDCDD